MTYDPTQEAHEPEPAEESTWMRLLWLILIAMLISVANTLQVAITILQVIIMAINSGKPNENLSDLGSTIGLWMAKAIRYQTAASKTKPWPWTELN